MIRPLSIIDDLAKSWGNLSVDLPGLALLAGPFIAGFIAGYVVKQGVKLVVLAAIAILLLEYAGHSTVPRLTEFIQSLVTKYGSQLLAVVVALNHVGIGFIIGFVAAWILT